MTTMLQKYYGAEIKALDEENATLTALASSNTIDRDQEIVIQSGWDLDAFRRNPLFAWGHQTRSDPQNILGKVTHVEVTPAGLVATFKYDVAINSRAKLVFNQVKEGTLKAFSVGFLPKEWVTEHSPEAHKKALPAFAQEALKSGKAFVVYTKAELIEISQVPIPSNPEALVSAGFKALRLAELKTLEEPTMTKTPSETLLELACAQPDTSAYLNSLPRAERELVERAAQITKLREAGAAVVERLSGLNEEQLQRAFAAMSPAEKRATLEFTSVFA